MVKREMVSILNLTKIPKNDIILRELLDNLVDAAGEWDNIVLKK